MTIVYRWQDEDRRGPYRIGVSDFWKDADHEARNPTFFEEFGWGVLKLRRPGEHLGCAFRSPEQMREWFNPQERRRVAILGYVFVEMDADRVLAESPRQLMIARRRPLRFGVRPVEVTA